MPTPSPTGSNGRDAKGRFAAGNRLARGNPEAQRVGKLRSKLIRAVSSRDIAEVVEGLVSKAKAGDTAAAKLLLDRVLGPPVALDILERIEQIESTLADYEQQTRASDYVH